MQFSIKKLTYSLTSQIRTQRKSPLILKAEGVKLRILGSIVSELLIKVYLNFLDEDL